MSFEEVPIETGDYLTKRREALSARLGEILVHPEIRTSVELNEELDQIVREIPEVNQQIRTSGLNESSINLKSYSPPSPKEAADAA